MDHNLHSIQLPPHLNKYIVQQNYEKYTPIDQATWRFCLRQLSTFFKAHGHPCYTEGLKITGISIEKIPVISEMSLCLQKFGWSALPVSGFIPPAAFMELQSLGVLPIACDMRTVDHILYTPAPDIVHEAAGHAPIIIDPEYAEYLKQYSQIAKKAIISSEDINMYEAIRDLSDIKENPTSTKLQIQKAEKKLQETIQSVSHISEAAQLSRMNWWTAEYGLIGDLEQPKIFGAGLLSSIGESKSCLSQKVKKIPISIDCIKQSYDITEQQPQLYVTPDFKTLVKVLNEFSETMAYKVGGLTGLNKALDAKTVNTVQLDSGFQIGGKLDSYLVQPSQGKADQIIYLKFSGPTQISFQEKELQGHHKNYHSEGFSTPLGQFTYNQLTLNQETIFKYESGFEVKGLLVEIREITGKAKIYSFKNAQMTYLEQLYFHPDWGQLDIITGENITSVFGGPADRISYGSTDDFIASKVPEVTYSKAQKNIFELYQKVRTIRDSKTATEEMIKNIFQFSISLCPDQWLLFLELHELTVQFKFNHLSNEIKNFLLNLAIDQTGLKSVIDQGLALSETISNA